MSIQNSTASDLGEAVEYLIVNETMIRSARALYQQALHNALPVSSGTKEELLTAIEHYGLSLAKEKQRVLVAVELHAYPIKVIGF